MILRLRRWRNEHMALKQENRKLREALLFYANPETYFGVAFLADPPTGGFDKDFEWFDANLENRCSEDAPYARQRPGKLAREVLEGKR